jgi:hypothetical protein
LDIAWSEGMGEQAMEIMRGPNQPNSNGAQRAAFYAATAHAFRPVAPAVPAIPPPGAPRPVVTVTNGEEGFLRFSWVSPDRRVNSVNGMVAPGTYSAPYRDGVKISSGLEAVGRFALYVVFPARYTVMLTPPIGTPVELGAVAPAFGQAGGGVEAFFPNGFLNANLHYHRLPDY